MASANRKSLVDPSEVGIYHCASQCVRRGNVHGTDTVSGLDRSHRCRWIQKRLADLAGVFAVEVLDYGLIDNSLHSLLRIRPDVTTEWTDEQVVRRWCQLNRRRLDLKHEPLSRKRLDKLLADKKRVAEWRKRLSDLSWFMIMLKEPIAREANIEDGVSGHFFGERFWCQRCWTLEEVTQSMMFAHTNPVRAGLAVTPETAEYSSYRDRLEDQRAAENLGSVHEASGVECERRTPFEQESSGWVEVAKPRAVGEQLRRRADFLAPLRLEGDGYDAASTGRRLTNDGYVNITLNDYRDVIEACQKGREQDVLGLNAEEVGQEREGDGGGGGGDESGWSNGLKIGTVGSSEAELAESDWRRWRESIPAELPVELERLGFDRVRWAESFRRNARRFDRLTRRSDSLRRDFLQRL
ncbi:MAG: hypothetical protein U1A77_23310 [Pirellulales bacterium]